LPQPDAVPGRQAVESLDRRMQQLGRRIKPGSELVRTWNGKTYRVMVMADGFAHDGKTFSSLSEIASDITGTNWNGPRFFGLRSASIRSDEERVTNGR
jgi:hypothetical protein